jgi:hypothetical protein
MGLLTGLLVQGTAGGRLKNALLDSPEVQARLLTELTKIPSLKAGGGVISDLIELNTRQKLNPFREVLFESVDYRTFQFSYRFVYDNNEKSVWSTKSIVPLPQQPTFNFTENDYLNNARISLSVSTGGVNVQKIELAFRETTNGLTSDLYLITQVDKTVAGILDNDIYTFQFYNDSIYSLLDIIETAQLQDWVPQKANAAELANGNVLLYSGITEGYEKTDVVLQVETQTEESQYFIDNCGLLDADTYGYILLCYIHGTLSYNIYFDNKSEAKYFFTISS